MSIDVETPPESIATGRSWRDLPASPPTAPRPMRTVAAGPIAPQGSRQNRRLWAAIAVALVAGLAVGVWSPWANGSDATETASPPVTTSAPEGIESLPDSIVPEPPDELFDQQRGEDPFGLFDDTPFSDRFPGIQNDLSLIELGPLPNGYRSIGSIVSRSGDDLRHQIRLLGPSGIATVRGERNPDAELPESGETIDIDGMEGRIEIGTTITVTWMVDDVVVTIEAPVEAGEGTLLDIARAVEVVG